MTTTSSSPNTEPAIVTTGLTKRYGRRAVVADAALSVPRGSVAGFIGPNGAGKTTTMAMLLGLVRPSAGGGEVLGESIDRPERYLHRVGSLLEGPALWPSLSARDNLRVLARLARHGESRIDEVLELVGLTEHADDRFGRFSLGMKQRLGIAAALIGDPELLVLDEPTNGLDPAGMRDMRDLIARVAAEQRTVLVSSHLLGELQAVCDWLVIVDRGRIGYCGAAGEFAGTSDRTITLSTYDPDDLAALASLVASQGHDAGRHQDRLIITADGPDPRRLAAELNAHAAQAGIALAEVHVTEPTIENAYLRMLNGEAA